MNRPKNPTGAKERKRTKPSSKTRRREEREEFERTIPGREAPEIEKKHDRVVNEDEQLKVVNQNEDNAQSRKVPSENEEGPADGSKENERLRHPMITTRSIQGLQRRIDLDPVYFGNPEGVRNPDSVHAVGAPCFES